LKNDQSDISSLDIDAQDSQILEESGVKANKIRCASFNMHQVTRVGGGGGGPPQTQ